MTLSGQTQREVEVLRNGRTKDQVTWADAAPRIVQRVVAVSEIGR